MSTPRRSVHESDLVQIAPRRNSISPGPRPTKILLIDPTDPWITNNRVLKHHDQVMLPIGLMYLSAYLKRHLPGRVEIRIISTIVDLSSPEELDSMMREFRPDIVGVRCVIFYAEQIREIVALARRTLPEATIVAGGPNVTFDNANLQANTDIDILVDGEGEETFLEIVALLNSAGKQELMRSLPQMDGIMFRQGGEVIRRPPRREIHDLDALPIPDYEAVDLQHYRQFLNYGYNRRPMGILFTSRGCPFHCTYCHEVFGKGFRARTPENVVAEITYLHNRYGISDFSIIDDNFTVRKPRVEEFTRLLIENGPKVRLYFPNGVRADSLDDELLRKMHRAGTIYMTFSLETASPRLQKLTKKHANIEKLAHIVNLACDLKIITNLCVMVGFPSETLQEARNTLAYYAQFDRIVLPYYFSVKYYPGTEIFRTAGQFGIDIAEETYKAPYHGYEFQETPDISARDFERLNQWYLRKIYLDRNRITNAIEILREHFTEAEIRDMFTVFFRRPVEDVERNILSAAVPA